MEFIYIPLNRYTHNRWGTRRLEMQKLGAGWGERNGVSWAGLRLRGGCGSSVLGVRGVPEAGGGSGRG